MTSSKAELLPCPFCGQPPKTFELNGTTQAQCAGAYKDCAGSDVIAPVTMWNRRYQSDADKATIEGLREEVARLRSDLAPLAAAATKREEMSSKSLSDKTRSFVPLGHLRAARTALSQRSKHPGPVVSIPDKTSVQANISPKLALRRKA